MPRLEILTKLVRHPRGRCANCARRRVLFSLVSTGARDTGESERMCAPCAELDHASPETGEVLAGE